MLKHEMFPITIKDSCVVKVVTHSHTHTYMQLDDYFNINNMTIVILKIKMISIS